MIPVRSFSRKIWNTCRSEKLLPRSKCGFRLVVCNQNVRNISFTATLMKDDDDDSSFSKWRRPSTPLHSKSSDTQYKESVSRNVYYDRTDIDTRDQSLMIKIPNFYMYITELLKKKESFVIKGKTHIGVTCPSCSKQTWRFISEAAYDRGTAVVRCMSCCSLCVLSDHLGIMAAPSDLVSSLHKACCTHHNLRLDKDTLEMVSAKDEAATTDDTSVEKKDNEQQTSDTAAEVDGDDVDEDNSMNECINEHYSHATLCHVDGDRDIRQSDAVSVERLAYEYDMFKYSAQRIPSIVSEFHWLQLIQKPSPNQRLKYYHYVFKTEVGIDASKEAKDLRRLQNKAERTELRERAESGEIVYGIGNNTIFRRLSSRYKDITNRWARCSGYQFGPEILYDLGYERDMNRREVTRCIQQMHQAYGWNSQQQQPARVLYTNCDPEGLMLRDISTKLNKSQHNSFLDITSLHPTQLYPQDRLVMLTPDAREEMPATYDGQTIYIINCLVDLGCQMPLALANAKQLNIRAQSFPLDRYLHWGVGGKNLCLDQCHKILLTWMMTGSWVEAFKHVPTRKLYHEVRSEVDGSSSRQRRLEQARRGGDPTLGLSPRGATHRATHRATRGVPGLAVLDDKS